MSLDAAEVAFVFGRYLDFVARLDKERGLNDEARRGGYRLEGSAGGITPESSRRFGHFHFNGDW